ncbi:MAG: hypothetical protein IPJ13_04065 [Saprospiraceae bacterium]|nr:hypothetical protein [Saprospiraceae bacterium]
MLRRGGHSVRILHISQVLLKKLFLDYQSQNGGNITNFQDYRHGYEIGYQRMLSNNVAVAIPLRYGVVNSDSINDFKKRIASRMHSFSIDLRLSGKRLTPYVFAGARRCV